jgi:adenosine deaminase
MLSYAYHDRHGIPWEGAIEGIASGRKVVKERHDVEMRFIIDIPRIIDPEDGVRLVEMTHESREEAGIIAIGLDTKNGNPASRQKPAFDRAAQLGFRRVAHVGEDEGPESVWDAINSLSLDRIDHGVRSIEDDKLVAHLVETQIPLTVCPVGNVALKIFPDMTSHSIKPLMDAGVFVTVNSDDPAMVKADLIDNYVQVTDTFDLTFDDVERLARNSFEASFLDDATKVKYLERFKAKVSELRGELLN